MKKKVLNAITPITQNSNQQNRLKTKALITNLGTATQLTRGVGGSQNEGRPTVTNFI